jgi:hypothetical protein
MVRAGQLSGAKTRTSLSPRSLAGDLDDLVAGANSAKHRQFQRCRQVGRDQMARSRIEQKRLRGAPLIDASTMIWPPSKIKGISTGSECEPSFPPSARGPNPSSRSSDPGGKDAAAPIRMNDKMQSNRENKADLEMMKISRSPIHPDEIQGK